MKWNADLYDTKHAFVAHYDTNGSPVWVTGMTGFWVETAEGFHDFRQGIFAGVAEGCVAKIVRQCKAFGQIFV